MGSNPATQTPPPRHRHPDTRHPDQVRPSGSSRPPCWAACWRPGTSWRTAKVLHAIAAHDDQPGQRALADYGRGDRELGGPASALLEFRQCGGLGRGHRRAHGGGDMRYPPRTRRDRLGFWWCSAVAVWSVIFAVPHLYWAAGGRAGRTRGAGRRGGSGAGRAVVRVLQPSHWGPRSRRSPPGLGAGHPVGSNPAPAIADSRRAGGCRAVGPGPGWGDPARGGWARRRDSRV